MNKPIQFSLSRKPKSINTIGIFITTCWLLPVLLVAQVPVNPNKTDAQGRRQGPWTILYDGTKPTTDTAAMVFYRLITYQDDKPVGVVKNIGRNGKLKSTASMVEDRPKPIWTGLITFYNIDGIKEAEMVYDNGKQVSGPVLYHPNGTVIPDSIEYLNNAGAKLAKEGKLAEAVLVYEKVLIAAGYQFAKNEDGYLKPLGNLITLYNKLGMKAKAESLLQLRKEIMGF
jgi:hypothetical protein